MHRLSTFAFEPPEMDSPNSDNFSDWIRYLSELESYLIKRKSQIQKEGSFQDHSEIVMQISLKMLECERRMLILNQLQYIKYEIDRRVWNSALYEIVNVLRQRVRRGSGGENSENDIRGIALLKLIDMGCAHYKNLIEEIQQAFTIDLTPLLEKNGFLSHSDQQKTAAVELLYRVLIYIGDLSRYGLISKFHRHQAFEYYEMARLCDVRKGRAFHQLGVAAFCINDLFGAAYNFTRACTVKSPWAIDGARHQILEVHDHAFKNHLRERNSYWYNLSKYLENPVKRERRYRKEIWILPLYDKTRVEIPATEIPPPTKEQHIASLTSVQLYNRFSLTYVLLWESLYTKIGTDQFEEIAEESLVYFEGLIQRKVKISFARVVQIVGFGLFILDSIESQNSMTKCQIAQIDHNKKLAVQYVLEMFSIGVEQLLKLVTLFDWDNPQLEYLSAAVKLWCNWLERHPRLWARRHYRPKFSVRRLEKSRYENRDDPDDDVWIIFAQLLTRLEVVLYRANEYVFPRVSEVKTEECSLLVMPLPEAIVLSGLGRYTDSTFFKTEYYSNGRYSKVRSHVYLRLKDIHRFGKEIVTKRIGYLLRTKGLYNLFEYSSTVKLNIPKSPSQSCGIDERNFLYWTDVRVVEDRKKNKFNIVIRPDSNNARIILRKIIKPKVEVVSRRTYPPSYAHTVWCAMHNRGYRSDMIVNPTRIIVDTNCFINKFTYVEKLVELSPYPIILPVTVVLELKGLSKGGLRLRHRETYGKLDSPLAQEMLQHGNDVAEKCKTALLYINSKLKYFKVVTTTGRVLPLLSIYQRVSDDFYDPTQRNDNRILDTCMHLEMTDKQLRARDTPFRLFRNTILITGDRGLRVKTLICDIPARDITSIVLWAYLYYKAAKKGQRLNGSPPK